MRQDGERSFDIGRNVEMSGPLENRWMRCRSLIGIRPITERLANLRDIRGLFDDRTVDALLDNFAKAIIACRDDRQPRCKRFETGVGKRIIKSRQKKNVGGGVDCGKIADRPKSLYELPIDLTATAATGDEKANSPA